MTEQSAVAHAENKSRLWKILWPFAQFLHGIAWLKSLSDRMKFVPVAFTIVVLWSILRFSNFSFMHLWISAIVCAFVMVLGLVLEIIQCTSAKFSFSKIWYDTAFAILTVTLGTSVFYHVLSNGKGLCIGDSFIFLMYMIDALFGPYIYLRTNFRSFVGAGISAADHDQQNVQVDVDSVDHHA